MIRWIVESSIKLRLLIIILAVVLMVVGVLQLRQMPVDVFPEIDPPYVEVQTEALGLSAEEVEAFITVPIEADLLNGVAWLDQIYSRSVPGLSSILLVFEPGTDPIRARQMVQERLTQAHALPNVSAPPVMMQPLSSSNRAMMVGLSSGELSLIEQGVLAHWNIKPRLLGVSGVANVAVWGQRDRQLQVQVDPEELHERGVTLQQIIETAGEALWVSPLSYLESSSPGTAGWIDTPNQRLSIRHLLPITTAEDLAKVAVVDRKDLVLGDVSNVVEDHQPLIGDAALNDGPGLILVIEKFPGANTLEVTQGVEQALKELQPGLQGMDIDTNIFRPADYIETTAGNLGMLALVGLALVALVLIAFYFNWRPTLISLFAIPLALVAAGMVLYLTGATFNMMLLLGMVAALVIVVDDAVVDVDNMARRLREQRLAGSDKPAESIIVDAILETRSPLGFALLIILLTVLPIFLIAGLAGAFVQPMAVSYILAMIASLLVALIVTPALSVTLLSGASMQRESSVSRGLQGFYNGLLASIVKSPIVALIIAGVFIVAGLIALPLLDVSLLPELKQSDLLIALEAAPGTSRPEMNRITAQAGAELRGIPGVESVGSHVGRAVTGDAIVGINSGEMWVSLDPAADYDATVAAVQDVIDGYPGLNRQVDTYQPDRLGEVFAGTEEDIVVRVYGHELDILREKAQEVAALMAGIDGVAAAQANFFPDEAQVEIEVDLAASEEQGIKPGDIRRQATILLSGIQVGSLFEEQKVFDVVVWGQPELRNNLSNISELMIDTPAGKQIALGDVAEVRIAPAATVIERDAVSRYIDVTADVSRRSIAAVSADIESGIQGIDVPFEYHMEVLSNVQGVQANQQRLMLVALAALIGIYLLMQAAFNSWSLAFFVLITTPMALAGGVLAVLLGGGVLTIGSLFGLFGVLAIAVRNGMVLVNRFQHLAQDAGGDVDAELVQQGARERVTPIVMTALATTFALVPFLFGGGMIGGEMVRPMAIVLIGGLVTATLLNLFVVPALYLRWPSTLPASVETQADASQEPAAEAA